MKKLKPLLVIITLVFICISGGKIKAQQFDKNFMNKDVIKFLNSQQNPLENSEEELFLLDEIIWHRLYGEKEFYLTPTLTDIKEYYDRIKMFDNKDLGIIKSKLQFIRIEASSNTREILNNVNINLPDYIQNSVLILIPEIDVEYLMLKGVNIELEDNYGKKKFVSYTKKYQTEVFWTEGFDDGFPTPDYSVGDSNPASGEDYWDDVTCNYVDGGNSLWSADIGNQPNCVNYDDDMWAYIYTNNGINVSSYENVVFLFTIYYETEEPFDKLIRFFSADGINWSQSPITYSGSQLYWDEKPVGLSNFTTYYWMFVFDTDPSIHNYEGAYLDRMVLYGDLVEGPDLVVQYPNAPSSAFPGDTPNISCTIKNIGNGNAGTSRVGYFLATNFRGIDVYLGDDFVSSLSPGETSNESETVTIPLNTSPGSYYITFFADYEIAVLELDEFNNRESVPIEITTPPPIAPSDLTATAVSSSQINLNWTDNSNNESGFKIERKTGSGGTWSQIVIVDVNITSYEDTGLNSNTKYYYQVRAYNSTGNSPYSNEANATTHKTIPDDPTNLTATTVSSSQINLNWTDNSNNEDGFKIERKDGSGGTWTEIATVGIDATDFSDTGLSLNIEYCYRVKAFNSAGNSGYTNDSCDITTGIIEMISNIPEEYSLKQNYPNPFNPSTTIEFSLKEESYTTLTVFNISGKEVKNLLNNESLPTGIYRLNFDASDLPSGIYFYRLQAGSFIDTKKMILLK